MKKINQWANTLIFLMLMMMTACAQKYQKDTFTTKSGKKVVLTAIKHASIEINYNGKEIEVDPVSGLEPLTDYSKFPKADLILITHDHTDHLDQKAISSLWKPGTILIANPTSAKRIMEKSIVIGNGEHLNLGSDILIDAVPAYNTTLGHLQFHPKGRDNGYVLTLDGLRVYIAGDTEDIPELKKLKNIDIAFLPVNQPFTMTPVQAAKAARIIHPKVLFPYHYSETKIERVAQLLKGSGIDVRIRNYQ
jgi:L-ascorbate metabolism protein UlaG (beta-lactamase superfamily)